MPARLAFMGRRSWVWTSPGMNRLRIKMGFLFQHAALYDSLTVEQNVAFPLERHATMSKAERRERVMEMLSSVGMERDLNKMTSDISGRHAERVGLARALVLQPEILLWMSPRPVSIPSRPEKSTTWCSNCTKNAPSRPSSSRTTFTARRPSPTVWCCWTRGKW